MSMFDSIRKKADRGAKKNATNEERALHNMRESHNRKLQEQADAIHNKRNQPKKDN